MIYRPLLSDLARFHQFLLCFQPILGKTVPKISKCICLSLINVIHIQTLKDIALHMHASGSSLVTALATALNFI